MNGLSTGPVGEPKSKYVDAASTSVEGAKGRNASRCLILALRVSFIDGSVGLARMLRAPSARGPNSIRP